jgi:LmbE family N-acetylglucosaminyl deacetylase
MIELDLRRDGGPLEILCLGAHSDDIEIGCGGSILEMVERREVRMRWVVFGAQGERADEARASAADFLSGAASSRVEVHGFRDGFFPTLRAEIKDVFEELKAGPTPHLVFTHDEADRHQDHSLLGSLTRETFRNHMVLGFEIPKLDGGLGSPNVFVPVDASAKDRKIELILRHFATQRAKHWFDEETLAGFMRLRGVECAAPTRYAEGFHCVKLLLGI